MLAGVFHLHEQEAREVMTPIPAVVTVDASDDASRRRCAAASPPGTPGCVVIEDENPDRVKGIVHNNSLARRLHERRARGRDRARRSATR